MIEWMLRAMAAAALLTVAALAVERAAAWLGRPRRWVWAAAMAASLLVPAAGVVAPGLLPRVDLLPRPLASAAAPTAAAAMGVPGGMMVDGAAGSASLAERASQVLAWGWLTASLVMLTAFGWAGLRLRLARDAWRPARVDGTRVLVAERAGPAVVGLRRPEIVIPRWVLEAAPGERALILRHEREHVAAGDMWLLVLAAAALAAAPWCLPLWWQHRRLRLATEIDCDARVLARSAEPRAYGRALLRTAGTGTRFSPLALAWGEPATHLEERIVAMTARRPAHPLLRSTSVLAAALLVAAAACNVVDADERAAKSPRVVNADRAPGIGESTYTENGDGTATIETGPSRPSNGEKGFSWGYVGSIPVDPSKPFPARMPNHAMIRNVRPGSPAEAAGLVPGDTILSVNGRDGREPRLFPSDQPGTEYVMRLRRNGVEREATLTVAPPRR